MRVILLAGAGRGRGKGKDVVILWSLGEIVSVAILASLSSSAVPALRSIRCPARGPLGQHEGVVQSVEGPLVQPKKATVLQSVERTFPHFVGHIEVLVLELRKSNQFPSLK